MTYTETKSNLFSDFMDYSTPNSVSNTLNNYTFNTSNLLYEDLLLENWWSVFDKKYLRYSIEWIVVQLIAYIFILVTGTIGNLMVILVVVKRPQMRSVTNIFIMNLAVADLLVIVFCVPVTLLANAFSPWILGSFMCKGVAYIQGVSVCASAYSLAAVSLDRSRAIYKSHGQPSGLTRNQAVLIIGLIWLLSLTLLIPWAVVFDVITSEYYDFTYCIETWENDYLAKIYFVLAIFICCYCLPLLLICITNLVIWCHVSNRKVPNNSASSKSIKIMHKKARHGVLKMLGIVTLLFLLSWLPLYVIVMRKKMSDNLSEYESSILDSLMPFAQWLGSWNSSINPIIYAFLNKRFREMFRSLLPAWMPYAQRSGFIRRRRPYFKGTGERKGKPKSTCLSHGNITSKLTQSKIKGYREDGLGSESRSTKDDFQGSGRLANKEAWNTNRPGTARIGIGDVGSQEIFVISEYVVLICNGTAVEV